MPTRLTKPTIWMLGLVLLAVVALALRPKKDELLIQLIDKRSGRPMTNVIITNLLFYRTPFTPIRYMPQRFRFRSSTHVIMATNGVFRVERISPTGFLVSQQLRFPLEVPSNHHFLFIGPDFEYTARGIWQYGFKAMGPGPAPFFAWQPVNRIEVPNHGPLILRLNPNREITNEPGEQ